MDKGSLIPHPMAACVSHKQQPWLFWELLLLQRVIGEQPDDVHALQRQNFTLLQHPHYFLQNLHVHVHPQHA
jgi:hypothetical protein